MKFLRVLALAASLAASAATADEAARDAVVAESNGIRILGAHAVTAGPAAPTAAAYMRIENTTAEPDRLVAAEGAVARRMGLHAHVLDNGIARMRPVADGIELPAGATVALERGGLHVMLMGLTDPPAPGAALDLTLVFERAGRIALTLPVESLAAEGH